MTTQAGATDRDRDLQRRVARLRSQGKIAEALAALNPELERVIRAPALAVEGIKLALIVSDGTTAHRLLRQLRTLPLARRYMHMEFLARLKIECPEADIPELRIPEIASAAPWVAAFLKSGEDPRPEVELSDVRVGCPQGWLVFDFGASCGHCRNSFRTVVAISLLVERRLMCPDCLGSLRLGIEAIGRFFVERRPDLVNRDMGRWDSALFEIQRKLGDPDPDRADVPPFCTMLGQNYSFVLVQLLLARITGGAA